jgi:hypothetical protein
MQKDQRNRLMRFLVRYLAVIKSYSTLKLMLDCYKWENFKVDAVLPFVTIEHQLQSTLTFDCDEKPG